MHEVSPSLTPIEAIAGKWWLILVRGLAAIAFGIVCFVWPALSLLVLVFLWGVYALIDGVAAAIWGAWSHWWSMLLVGAVSVLAGVTALLWPGLTALTLLYLIAAWAVVRGVAEIAAAIRSRQETSNEWLLLLGGAVSILFGILVALFPGAGALSVLWMIGTFAIVFGMVAVVLSLRLRSLQRAMRLASEEPFVGAGTPTPDEHTR